MTIKEILEGNEKFTTRLDACGIFTTGTMYGNELLISIPNVNQLTGDDLDEKVFCFSIEDDYINKIPVGIPVLITPEFITVNAKYLLPQLPIRLIRENYEYGFFS